MAHRPISSNPQGTFKTLSNHHVIGSGVGIMSNRHAIQKEDLVMTLEQLATQAEEKFDVLCAYTVRCLAIAEA